MTDSGVRGTDVAAVADDHHHHDDAPRVISVGLGDGVVRSAAGPTGVGGVVGENDAGLDRASLAALGVDAGDVIEIQHDTAMVWARAIAAETAGPDQVVLGRLLWQQLVAHPGDALGLRRCPPLPAAASVVITLPSHLSPGVRERLAKRLRGAASVAYPDLPLTVRTRHGVLVPMQIGNCSPAPSVLDWSTEIQWSEPDPVVGQAQTTLADLGGMTDVLARLRELVALPLLQPALFRTLGTRPPKGVLLYGPPGTGKTLTCRGVATALNVNTMMVSATELSGTAQGETEANLRLLFSKAVAAAPCLIVVDEFDAIAAVRDQMASQEDVRATSQLLGLMDGLHEIDGVLFMATTNRRDAVDPAFRRPGRLEAEIFVGPPDEPARRGIIAIHTRAMPLLDVSLEDLAADTPGFVGADLMNLCRAASLQAVSRIVGEPGDDPLRAVGEITPTELVVTAADFAAALRAAGPSAARSNIPIAHSGLRWADVAGLDELKTELVEVAERALAGEPFAQGVLLSGASGTGKTAIVEALATHLNANLVTASGSQVFTQWLGESEAAVRSVFERAVQLRPSVLLFDQLEALAVKRGDDHPANRAVAALLSAIDLAVSGGGVFVVGVTDRPDLIDPAVVRSGRLGRHLKVPLPDSPRRRALLLHAAERWGITIPPTDLDRLGEFTEGWTPADLVARLTASSLTQMLADSAGPS